MREGEEIEDAKETEDQSAVMQGLANLREAKEAKEVEEV